MPRAGSRMTDSVPYSLCEVGLTGKRVAYVVGTGGQGATLNDTLADLLFAFGRWEEINLLKELMKYLRMYKGKYVRQSLVWFQKTSRSGPRFCR